MGKKRKSFVLAYDKMKTYTQKKVSSHKLSSFGSLKTLETKPNFLKFKKNRLTQHLKVVLQNKQYFTA